MPLRLDRIQSDRRRARIAWNIVTSTFMTVKFAHLADGANVSSEGKLNLLGIFGAIAGNRLPVTHAKLVLVLQVELTSSEFGITRPFRVVLIDEDGREVTSVQGEIHAGNAAQTFAQANMIIPFEGLSFPAFGSYRFDVLAGDDHKASVPLLVTKLPVASGGILDD